MSFILDALKKSESDRQRQNGPALFEVKVAPRRLGLPLWALAIALLLGVNLIIVMWMLLRHPGERTETSAATAAAAAAPTAPQPVRVPAPPVVNTAAPATATLTVPTPVANAAQAAGLPPAQIGASGNNNAAGTGEANPEDFAPAAEPVPMLGSHVKRGTAEGVQLYQQAATAPGTHVPQLRLDLHVYGANPADRFVLINMKKLREGDSLPEGVRVESITPEGAILSFAGQHFLLPRE